MLIQPKIENWMMIMILLRVDRIINSKVNEEKELLLPIVSVFPIMGETRVLYLKNLSYTLIVLN